MVLIEGYDIKKELYRASSCAVFRAIRNEDGKKVIIKMLLDEYPSLKSLKQLKREFEILKFISQIPGVVHIYDLKRHKNAPLIIMEDCGGDSVDRYLALEKFEIAEFLDVAIKTTHIINDLHNHSIIHKDIKPHNIVYNRETGVVKIIDFNLSVILENKGEQFGKPNKLAGTYDYISPEQTSLIDQPIDYRTDFYSLGATFYHMITGQVPFKVDDSKKLITYHISKQPISPHKMDKSIPKPISAIIMKLMGKSADSRYQSAFGLISDLEQCRDILQENGDTGEIEIGLNDVPQFFRIPKTFIGRTEEQEYLTRQQDKAALGEKVITFVKGVSGIGKSSLITQFKKSLHYKRIYRACGKYDGSSLNVPYSAFLEACSDLCMHLLTRSKKETDILVGKVLDNVGDSARVITDNIPKMRFILGEQPELPGLPPLDAQNRFNMVFSGFIKALADSEHPLVMIIDDLQWIDNASLQFFENLITDPDLKFFHFIGLYRDNEVDPEHRLAKFHTQLDEYGVTPVYLKIGSLEESAINELVASCLYKEPSETGGLAAIIRKKTGGNPFFIKFFLKSLSDDALLRFDNGWYWDQEQIEETSITNNVIELMLHNLSKMPGSVLHVLRLMSCCSGFIRVEVLGKILNQDQTSLLQILTPALDNGLIYQKFDKLFFVHDKVKEAVYSLVDDESKKTYHYRIGKTIYELAGQTGMVDDRIFDIAAQLNTAYDFLTDKDRKIMRNINLKAGLRAKSTAAFEAASDFFRHGTMLLDEDSWKTEYELTFSLNLELAESLYLIGDKEGSEALLESINSKITDDSLLIKLYMLKIRLYENQIQYDKAMKTALDALTILGVAFPKDEKELDAAFALELESLIKRLDGISITMLKELGQNQDGKIEKTIMILSMLSGEAYQMGLVSLFGLTVISMVRLTLDYGNNVLSSHAYIFLALIIYLFHQDYDLAYTYGELSIFMADKYNNPGYSCPVYHIFANGMRHWKKHLKDASWYFEQSIQQAKISGNRIFHAYTLLHVASDPIIIGESLEELQVKIEKYLLTLKHLKNKSIYQLVHACALQPVKNLRGELDNQTFSDENFNEDEYLETYKDIGIYLAHYAYCKIRSLYLFGNQRDAVQLAEKYEETVATTLSVMVKLPEFYYFYALSITRVLKNNRINDEHLRENLSFCLEKLRVWSENCPENYASQYYLVKAECAALDNDDLIAPHYYTKAIESAITYEYLAKEAVSNECAALYYYDRRDVLKAKNHMNNACYAYLKWGARAKVNDLEKMYPQLIKNKLKKSSVCSL